MKVIFIEDVPNVARAGETKVVADGYGRNYLLPRRLAVLADSRASALVEAQLKKRERMVAQTEAEMAELAAKLNGIEITLKAKAGAKERLYGSITSADIAEALSQKSGSLVDKRKIELAQPIHQLGSYDVTVRFTHEISAVVKLTVVGEGEAAAEAEATEKKEAKKIEVKAEEVKAKTEPEKKAEKKEKKPKAEKKSEAEKAEAKPEEKKEKAKAKAPKQADDVEAKAEKKEKKSKAKAEKPEAPADAKPEKVEKKADEGGAKAEKKGKAKKKVEEAGEKDAEPGK